MAESNPISVSLLLNEDSRNPPAIEAVREIASKLGFTSSSAGRATVSLKISPSKFEDVFGIRPQTVKKGKASNRDFEQPAGYRGMDNLPIPSELTAYVQSMSVEPPPIRFDNDVQD